MSKTLNTKENEIKALCTLSGNTALNPESLSRLIADAPDPETAVRHVLDNLTARSDILQTKWRKVITNMWSAHHPHLPGLLNLPIAARDVEDVIAVDDAHAYLNAVFHHPGTMALENKEWLLNSPDVYFYATQLSSLNRQPLLHAENEWQYLLLRRMRAVLQSLRLIRRVKNKLVIVQSRYERFLKLPATHQYYLLWHAETYHIDWSQFSGIWGDYLKVVQEYLPVLWNISAAGKADMPRDLRQWNQDMWDSFFSLWDQEQLLERKTNHTALFNLVRIHSLPTALTQVILKDLFERYGIVRNEDMLFVYTRLGTKLIAAEQSEELPCALDLLT